MGSLVHGQGKLATDHVGQVLLAYLTHRFQFHLPLGWFSWLLALRKFVGGHGAPRDPEADSLPSYF